ncbi:protocadherin-15 isoform X2 [Acipenser ruthenus]|uniref:protocadherin-15 isoform X2 n=1 Tax=Acipenser ruthenus TaxID=7906 RepID=UPI002741C174|nr:protocadherin-15 isoform X2 [Acipenser ruthenus]
MPGLNTCSMLKLWRTLICQLAVSLSYHIVKANLCHGGSDITAAVRENSPNREFIANLSIIGNPGVNSIRLCLTGDNADWFFLEGKTIRLNSSSTRVLDREEQGSILVASLTCYENDSIQTTYRIMVEILNENDNRPEFLPHSIQPLNISELTSVNTVIFTVRARDADDDTIVYIIDTTLPDASYFRIDLPNSGRIVLAKPLDYETKSQLELIIFAMEMNTDQKYNTSVTIKITVLDGDDQYPQFLPCTLWSQDQTRSVCTNPVYTVNVTEKQQGDSLHFSPGPVYAEDGDKGLRTPVKYTILSGADNGRFRINNVTGEVIMTRPVENRLLTPTLKLRIMAFQVDDPKKYTVATALIRVLAVNRFPPQFNQTTYKGFIMENPGPAALVTTYRNAVLLVQALDQDFREGLNPKIQYSLTPKSNNTRVYQITQEGLLIAKANQLRPHEKHFLEVIAVDQESGETAKASVDIEVLPNGQEAPASPFGGDKLYSLMDMGVLGGSMGTALLLLILALFVVFCSLKKRRKHQDTTDRASVAMDKHPNVVNPGKSMPLVEEISYQNEGYNVGEDEVASNISDKNGGHTKNVEKADVIPHNIEKMKNKEHNLTQIPNDLVQANLAPQLAGEHKSPSIMCNGKMVDRSGYKSVWFKDEVLPKESNFKTGQYSVVQTLEVHLEPEQTNEKMDAHPLDKQDYVTDQLEDPAADMICETKNETPDIHLEEANVVQQLSSPLKGLAENQDSVDEPLENPYKNMYAAICEKGNEDTTEEHNYEIATNETQHFDEPQMSNNEEPTEGFSVVETPLLQMNEIESISPTAVNEFPLIEFEPQKQDCESRTQSGLVFYGQDSMELSVE